MTRRFKATMFPFVAASKVAATLAAADVTGNIPTDVKTVKGVDADTALQTAATASITAASPIAATVADKAGYSLAATGLDSITVTEPTGKPTTFPGWIMWLIQRFRRSAKSATQIKVLTEAGATVTTQAITSSGDDQTLGTPS